MITPSMQRAPIYSGALQQGLAVIEPRCVVGYCRSQSVVSAVLRGCAVNVWMCMRVSVSVCSPPYLFSNVETQTHNSAQVFRSCFCINTAASHEEKTMKAVKNVGGNW